MDVSGTLMKVVGYRLSQKEIEISGKRNSRIIDKEISRR
jgi:hypothetical protein